MAKIKVVQIAVSETESNETQYFLDDRGRVWYQEGHWDRPREMGIERIWVLDWRQLDLPDEPEES